MELYETSSHGLLIRAQPDEERLVLALHGELDIASAPALAQQLHHTEAIGVGRAVIDLSGLAFCDASGLHVLLDAQRRLWENHQQLFLRGVPKVVQRLLELSGTLSRFRFDDDPQCQN